MTTLAGARADADSPWPAPRRRTRASPPSFRTAPRRCWWTGWSPWKPGRRLVAHRTVAAGPGFHPGPARRGQGDDPSLPFGLLLESWAQAAVLLACWERPNPDVLKGDVALLAGVRDVRALAPVEPGAVLVHEVRVLRDLGDTVLTTGTTVVGDRTVLEVGQLTLALRPAESLDPAAGTTAKTTDERS